MKKMMTYSVLALLFVSVALLTCSNNKEAESESENRIRTPINKARSVKDRQEDRFNDMDESLKE
jgi:hypothetical protein